MYPCVACVKRAVAVIKPIRRATRRSAAYVEAMSVARLAHVKPHPGRRGEQVAEAMRSDVETIRLPMKALIAAKKVKTKGQRRGMRYSAA